MKDADKDKERLINELGQLRQRIAELETCEAERKKTEEALRASEAKYKELAESITDVFYAMDEKLRLTYWNKASEEFTGVAAEDALGKHVYDIFPDTEAIRRAVNTYRMVLTTKEPQHYVNEHSLRGIDYVFDVNVYPTKSGLCVYVKDITEHRKLEDALRESEQWYRYVFDNAPFGIGFTSIDGRVITLNKSMENITGYSAEDFEKINIADIYVNRADREALLQEVRRHGFVIDHPAQMRRKDGTLYDVFLSVRLTTVGDREFLQTILYDVTERKRTEEKLRASERRLKEAQTLGKIGNWEFDLTTQEIEWSDAVYELYERDKALGPPSVEEEASYYPPEESRRLREFYRLAVEKGEELNYDLTAKLPSGKTKFFNASMSPVKDEEGRVIKLFGTVHDITERKKAEETLKESEERYRALVELSPEAIFVASEGKHVFTNSAGMVLLGASSPDQIIGKPVMEVIHPDYREIVAGRIREIIETGTIASALEERFIRLDGIEVDVEARAAPLIYQGKPAIQAVVHDVSERKKAQESLRLSEQNFRDSIEKSPLGIRIVTEDGKTLYVNKALLDICGYSSFEELEAVPRKQLYTPESYVEHRKRVGKRKRGEHVPPNYEISIVRKDGQVRNLSVSRGDVLWDGEKQFQVLYQDISERKAREEEYRAIIRTTIDGFWQADMDGHFLDVNEAYCRLSGYSHSELLNMSITDVEATEKPEETSERIQKIRQIGYDRFESCHRRKDGSIINVEISVNYLPIDSGRMFVFIRDITERKWAEKALKASETRYRLLAENVRDVIWAMDMDLRFTYVSPSVKYLGGRTAEEVMSMSMGQLLAPTSQELAMKTFAEELVMANVTPLGPTKSRMLEVEIIRRDGFTLWAELKMNFMRDSDGRAIGILGVMRDITERKKAEEDRREFEQKAQLASHLASVGELAAGVAHEINNPLTGVIGYAELLMQEDVPEHIKSDLKIIHDGAKRVADIVKGLLTFARQAKPERVLIDINQVIQVALRLRAYELETGNMKVTTKLAPDLPLTIADPGQLQQVFLNLIINAEMEMKSAHGKGKLAIKTEHLDDAIRISFKDDGPGIAEENLEKIFDPFFTTREVGKGTGLGLSICHGIVIEHGGRIYAESKLGKGATFIVELPVVTEEKRSRRAKPALKSERATKGKILVVDDEPVVRRLLSQVLTAEGHDVEATDDGNDALDRIKGNRYSLILLDMKLPGMSGSELYGRIQEIAESLAQRVVFITGDVMGADTEAFLARTGVPYIHKPFDVKQLSTEIKRLLAKPRPKPTHQVKNQKPKVKN